MNDLNLDIDGQTQKVDHLIPESSPGELEVNFSAKAQRDKFLGGGFFGKFRKNLSGQKKPEAESERRPNYWRKKDKGNEELDFQIWRQEFLKLPTGEGFYKTIKPAIENEGVLEIIKIASIGDSYVWDDLTGKTQGNVMAEKINLLFKRGKKALISSFGDKSFSERRSRLPALEQTFNVLKGIANKRNEIDISEFDLGLEDRVRFVVAGRMGHGTVAANVPSILETGLVVNPKRSTSKIPAISGKTENLRQFGQYDPLTYRQGENSSTTLVYGNRDKMDDGFIDINLALKKGNVRKTKGGEYVFTAQPELILCETEQGKEIVLKNLPKGLQHQWKDKVMTYEELVDTRLQPISQNTTLGLR